MLAPLFLALAVQMPAQAQGPFTATLSPGTTYDPSIPTLVEVAGHDFDEEVTAPPLVNAYMRALANASDRAAVIEYGRTWEGRALNAIVIGSADRIARLDEIKAGMQRLANPDMEDQAEIDRLIGELPVITALVHGVHGNEISSSGAAMAEAYHLLAAQNDPRADLILAESLVLIDPMQNADGRARFVLGTVQGRARWADSDPISAEHDEPWPGGRTNHYLFDLNRDWFAQTQLESRGRVAMLLEFQPQVTVDLHEMGGNSTYYFPPAAVPGNTHITPTQNDWFFEFGRNNADEFDSRGFPYFTRDVFDSFYPGYGASWPTTHGSLGMTFEQASARGLVLERNDGTLLTYGIGVMQHWTAALRTAHTAAANREALLRDFVEFRRSAIAMADDGTAEYVLHSAHDPLLAERLARTLVSNGIRVGRTTEALTVDGRTIPAGEAYVVPAGQPAGRLVRNLLDDTTPLPEDFVQVQIERRANRLPDQIYDVTAWSMPRLWDVESIEVDRATGVSTEPVGPRMDGIMTREAPLPIPAARVGWLIRWNTAGAAAVADAVRQGLKVRVGTKAFTLQGEDYAVGTAIVRVSDNGPELRDRLTSILHMHGVEAVPVNDSFVDSGMSLGANQVVALTKPNVMLAWDRPGSAYSAGWVRYILEQRYGTEVTAVRAASMGRATLSDYDVIVLPDGNYGSVFNDGFVNRLRQWMREGGTLITMANSTVWASRVGLLDATTEMRGGAPAGSGGDKPTQEQPIDYLEAIAPASEAPEQTPGAILNVDLDTTHWLSAGTDGRVGALVSSSRIFTPMTLNQGQNVGIYAPPEDLIAGGIVWEDAQPQLPYKAYLMRQGYGGGQLIAFAEDPNYRAYAEATSLLFFNAVMIGGGGR